MRAHGLLLDAVANRVKRRLLKKRCSRLNRWNRLLIGRQAVVESR
jgi:hypothetical protein